MNTVTFILKDGKDGIGTMFRPQRVLRVPIKGEYVKLNGYAHVYEVVEVIHLAQTIGFENLGDPTAYIYVFYK